MIIVTGATGRLGSHIVDHLLGRVPAPTIGVSVREVGKATALSERGVRVRAGDFTDPSSLEHAFEGAEQVLVVSAAIRGAAAGEANRAAIDAARAAGARRILYTSHQAASTGSLFPPQITHAETEQYLADQDVPFTALRNGFYTSTLAPYLAEAVRTGRLAVPADGPFSWTAHGDLAEVAVTALTRENPTSGGALDGVTPALTAPEALDFEAVAAIASELTGRPVTRVVVDDDTWRAEAVAGGLPPTAADFTLTMFRAARRGEFAVTDPILEAVLDRPATTVRSVLEQQLQSG